MVLKPDLPSAHERRAMRDRRIAQRELLERMIHRFPQLRDRSRDGGEMAPADPSRPLDLSGGAAAALDFED